MTTPELRSCWLKVACGPTTIRVSSSKPGPRQLAEIASAEQEFFDRVWYHRSLSFTDHNEPPADPEVERIYTEEGQLGPHTDFELGMLNRKLSALRRVLDRHLLRALLSTFPKRARCCEP